MSTPGGVSVLQPLSEAIFAVLNVAALKAPPPYGAGCVGGVTDNPIQGRPFPYLWYEVGESDLSGLGQGPDIKVADLRLHVFSTAGSFAEAQTILRTAGEILRFVSPVVNGWAAVPINRPAEATPLPFEELNGIKVLELVGFWTVYLEAGGVMVPVPPAAHHTTHEPGGSDALTALDAGILTTGTIPDARLSSNVALETTANVFTANQQFNGLLQFGGTSSAYPALKRSGAELQARLADDSNFAVIKADRFWAGTSGLYGPNGLGFYLSDAQIYGSGPQILLLANIAGTDFNRLQFGGTTNAFPALKRDTIFLQLRLADNSGVSGAVTASLPAAAAARDGIIGFDTTLNALVYYVGGQRFRLAGTSF